MTPELQNTLANLASKLGTSVEKLWPLLVARTRFEAIIGVIFGAAGAFVCYRAIKKAANGKRDHYGDWELPNILIVGIGSIAFTILLCASVSSIPDIFFPEVGAIKTILGK